MRTRSLLAAVSLLVPAYAFSQAVDEFHHIIFSTVVGSYKMQGFNDTNPSKGKLVMSFTGTFFISGYEGAEPIVTGSVRKQYENKERKKVSYFGTGTITIDGKWVSSQWFGRDMKGEFWGSTVLHLYGEYDRNGQTGQIRYGVEKESKPWFQGGRQVDVPMPDMQRQVVPKVRNGG